MARPVPLPLLRAASPLLRRTSPDSLLLFGSSTLLSIAALAASIVTGGTSPGPHHPPGSVVAVLIPTASASIVLFVGACSILVWGRRPPRIPDECDVARVRWTGRTGGGGVGGVGIGADAYNDDDADDDGESSTDTFDENDAFEENVPPPAAPSSPLSPFSRKRSPPPSPRGERRRAPPSPPPSSELWTSVPGAPSPPERPDLTALGPWFRDGSGRVVILRGANLGGCCKLPTNGIDGRGGGVPPPDVTFVGRPLPLDEADVHLSRLRAWGYVFVRLLFTWEAVEHSGPGVYDEEYLAYLVKLCRLCRRYGMSVFLDCHQDCWSRYTGGSGAPAWTLEKAGFDLSTLEDSGAAFTEGGTEDIPRMAWNSNNSRLAAGTMWTLFFAGDDFAPKTRMDGTSAQEYLQSRFCSMLGRVAEAVKEEPNVVGFDLLNEPSNGFVGTRDVRDISDNHFMCGWRVDVWSAILMGAGYTRTVDFFSGFFVYGGRRILNPGGARAWRRTDDGAGGGAVAGAGAGDDDGDDPGASCVWRRNGVWSVDASGEPALNDPGYFYRSHRRGGGGGRGPVDFSEDYALPLWERESRAVRHHMPDAIIFMEPVLDMTDPGMSERPRLAEGTVGERGYVWAKHFYDGVTLMTGGFSRWLSANPVTGSPLVGLRNIQRSFGRTLSKFREEASHMGPGGSPVLVGECGVPFNVRSNRDFTDLAPCTCALNTTMRAVELALVSCSIWNYDPTNTNRRGDHWNGEDLSLYSDDQRYDPKDLHSGGRSLAAAIRPYALRTAGVPLRMEFDPYRRDRRFVLTFRASDGLGTNETVIFLPRYHYPRGAEVEVREGDGEWDLDWEGQALTYWHRRTGAGAGAVHTIVVTKDRRGAVPLLRAPSH